MRVSISMSVHNGERGREEKRYEFNISLSVCILLINYL